MTPKDQCDEVYGSLLERAKITLMEDHEFYQMGGVMTSDGKVHHTLSYGGNEYPKSEDVINELKEIHKELADKDEIIVSAIVYDGRITSEGKKRDAIIVNIEHRDGYSTVAGLYYKFGLFRRVIFEEPFAHKGEHEIF